MNGDFESRLADVVAPTGRRLGDLVGAGSFDLPNFLNGWFGKKTGGETPSGYQPADLSGVPQAPAWDNGQGIPADARANLLKTMMERAKTGNPNIPNPAMPTPTPAAPAAAPQPGASDPVSSGLIPNGPGDIGNWMGRISALKRAEMGRSSPFDFGGGNTP